MGEKNKRELLAILCQIWGTKLKTNQKTYLMCISLYNGKAWLRVIDVCKPGPISVKSDPFYAFRWKPWKDCNLNIG